MKKKVLHIAAFPLWICSASAALPMTGSPDRCADKGEGSIILPVDNLLPQHYAEGEDMQKSVEKFSGITLERILQSVVDHLYTYHDLCGEKVAGVGGWTEGIGIALCERLAAFDITHARMLSEKPSLSPSSEVTFLRTVYKACRKSTDRYWNYPLIIHVSYKPTLEELGSINKAMGQSLSIGVEK